MEKEQCTELLDTMVLSISNQLINMPEQLGNSWEQMPYGGPAIPHLTYLYLCIEKAQELAEEYLSNEWWKDDASRLDRDELNAGTLLYAYRKNRKLREGFIEIVFKYRKGKKPFMKRMQYLDQVLIRGCNKAKFKSRLALSFSLLARTLLHIYELENPEHLNSISYYKLTKTSKKRKPKTYSQHILKTIHDFAKLKDDLEMSMDIFQEPSTFLCTLISLSFELDHMMTVDILSHNKQLVENQEFRRKSVKNDQMLYNEGLKAYRELTKLMESLRAKIKETKIDTEEKGLFSHPYGFASICEHTVGLFCILLRYNAVGKCIKDEVAQNANLRELITETF